MRKKKRKGSMEEERKHERFRKVKRLRRKIVCVRERERDNFAKAFCAFKVTPRDSSFG